MKLMQCLSNLEVVVGGAFDLLMKLEILVYFEVEERKINFILCVCIYFEVEERKIDFILWVCIIYVLYLV